MMQKLATLTALLALAFTAGFGQTRAKQKADDFVPGDITLFEDSLKGEHLGEFPSRWDLKNGLVEVMQMDGMGVIGFVRPGSEVMPLMNTSTYLPEHFTLEFDVYFHNRGNEAYTINFDNPKMRADIRNTGIRYQGYLARLEKRKAEEGWRHVSISFNKRAYKVYLDGERLVNTPNVEQRPHSLSISALSHNVRYDKYAMLTNLRLAEGGMPLYERLMTEGRFVTTHIHFESDKANLEPASLPIIRQVAAMLKAHPEMSLIIEGHTDGDGSERYNLELSQKRAAAVKHALVKEGVASPRLRSEGFGESKPVAFNDTEEGKAANRRVAFVLVNN